MTRLSDSSVKISIVATLFAVCLGSAVTWATTGVFLVDRFLIAVVPSLIVQLGLIRLKPYLPWIALPVVVLLAYRLQTGQLDWRPVWPAIVLSPTWVRSFWRVFRGRCLSRRAIGGIFLAVCGILLASVALKGIPAWCVLCLLTAPLAWRVWRDDKALIIEWETVTRLFLVVGYVIKGLIR